jgi:hypothetical protein
MALTTKFSDNNAGPACHSLSFVSHPPGLSPLPPQLVSYIFPQSPPIPPGCLSSKSCDRSMVALDLILRISTIFLALDTALASHQTLVRRAVDGLHLEAARRTRSLAKDMRMAFGGILPRAVSSSQPGQVVYCKLARQVPLSSNGGSSNGTSTSMSIIGTKTPKARPTSTKTSTSTSPTVSSSWRLIDSNVRIHLNDSFIYITIQFCSVGRISLMAGISSLGPIQLMVRSISRFSISHVFMAALY